MAKRKQHPPEPEEHADETWLVPYSDILTLLLALFIVLFASAHVEQNKFQQIADSFSSAFNSGGPSIFNKNNSSHLTIVQGQPSPEIEKVNAVGEGERDQAYHQENAQLSEAKQALDNYIKSNGMGGDLTTAMTEDGLIVRIKDKALYASGSAVPLAESRQLADKIAKMLTLLPQKVIISGHTDNVPINTAEFPSNWDLSSKRAITFMKLLLADGNLQPERFSAIGYGEYRPAAANDTSEGRAQNRRVEILIMRNYRPGSTM